MKQILIISNTAFSIEKFREHYLSKITNYQFIIYTPNKISKLKKKYRNIEVKKFNTNNIIDDFKELFKIFKNTNSSNIVVYSYKYQLIVSILKKFFFRDYEIISIIAGRGSWALGNILKIFIYKKIIRLITDISKIVICINPSDLKYFKNYHKDKNKFFLLPTEGVETENLAKINKKNNNNFIFFGRLIKEKGIKDYIEAAKIIKIKYPEKNFFIAGPINQSIIGQSKFDKGTLALIKKNENYIEYLGFIKDYKNIFPKMDCLISPSFSEGAGTSVMEAMVSGLHVITYNNSGHNYVLKNTKNHICKINSVEYLVQNIEKYMNTPSIKNIYNKKTSHKKILNNFSAKIIAKRFNTILDLLCGSSKKKVDVVWPYYKDGKFLDASISRLNNQTLQPHRLIFIDDNNERHQELKKYIRKKLNKNIKFNFIRNKKNYGVTKSVSIGIKQAKSKYLYIQSTDDLIYKDFLELNVNVLENNKNAAYVFSNIRINNLDNKKKYHINFSFIKESYIKKSDIDYLYSNYLFKIYHNTVVFNSKKVLKLNIFKDEYGRRADMLNLQYLSMRYGFCYLNKTISEFTIRKGQISSAILSNDYLIDELKYLKKKENKFYNFIIKNNLYYEISLMALIKFKSTFGNLITIQYLSRAIKFKLWKLSRFYINPKILNFLFRILN
jgi:galacturonosyltransferase